jgi:hypothetical protein
LQSQLRCLEKGERGDKTLWADKERELMILPFVELDKRQELLEFVDKKFKRV